MKTLRSLRHAAPVTVLAGLLMIAIVGTNTSNISLSPSALAATEMSGQWTAQVYKSGEIQLNFVLHSEKNSFNSFGETFAASSFEGLASADLMSSAKTNVNFSLT